jgi:ABC-type multidrug transport system fused ATPase/permease subunit
VAANLTFGFEEAGVGQIDGPTLTEALAVTRAEGFVARLPAGIDTLLGERGVTLSGGQRQRLALARALVRRPGLLLLDDATSAVDPVVEAETLARLAGLGAGGREMTLLVVAHRLSTIRLADRVVFLQAGTVAANGSHLDLLALPAYAELARAYEEAEEAERQTAWSGEDDAAVAAPHEATR